MRIKLYALRVKPLSALCVKTLCALCVKSSAHLCVKTLLIFIIFMQPSSYTMTENEITDIIIQTAIEIHKELGPGLLESVYEKCLERDLQEIGLNVISQLGVPLRYKDLNFDIGYRLDLLVENKVIIEIKSVEILAPVHYSQLLTYLKLMDKRVGLLINFNSKYLKEGLHRLVNNYND